MNAPHAKRPRRGLTLVELLLALTLLGLLSVMLFGSFHAVVRSWEAGRAAIDNAGHADYLMDQLVAALRSAYCPGQGEDYGLILTDDGDDNDAIEWCKVGPALVGEDAEFAPVPHRVRVFVTPPDGDFPGGFTVRAWRQALQLDDFDPELDTVELTLSPRVIGLNCRVLDPDQERNADDTLNWADDWAKTNTLPAALELTLLMRPAEDGEDPTETKRIVEIPLAELSQNPTLGASANKTSTEGASLSAPGGGFQGTGSARPAGPQNAAPQPPAGLAPPTPR